MLFVIQGLLKTIDYRCFKNINTHMCADLFKVPWKDVEKHDNVDDALKL